MVLSREKLCTPVYIHELKTEQDAKNEELLPLVYIWNEGQATNSFSLSINGRILGYLLEPFCSRDDPEFSEIVNKTASALSQISRKLILSACEESGLYPSELF